MKSKFFFLVSVSFSFMLQILLILILLILEIRIYTEINRISVDSVFTQYNSRVHF